MPDTNPLPPMPEPEGVIVVGTQALRGFTADQMRAYALQARAQVQGEAFGYIHHFAAHDERGVLIDTTWEADGCADPLPHPTFPSMWKWAHCTPFYTTPQPVQATQADVTDEELLDAYNSIDPCNESPQDRLIRRLRAILALRPERVPMTDEQRQLAFLSAPTSSGGHRTAFMLGIAASEAHHGITAQAKQEPS